MRIRPQKILWPTDLSTLSLKGAAYARAFCEAFDARLHVIHVTPILVWADSSIPLMTGGDMLVTTTDTVAPAMAALQKFLARQFDDISQIKTHVVAGRDWQEICRYAQEHAIDLIVIATHGATGLRHLVMGSTAERVVQHAHCPVLTVKSFDRDFIAQGGHTSHRTKVIPERKIRRTGRARQSPRQ